MGLVREFVLIQLTSRESFVIQEIRYYAAPAALELVTHIGHD